MRNKNKKKLLSTMLSCALLISAVSPAYAGTSSVDSDAVGHWASETLDKWTGQELLSGYEDGTIRPDRSITRAEAVSLINQVFGFTSGSTETGFSDVAAGAWYSDKIAAAVKAQYISGYPDGTFLPDREISREEFAVMLMRLFKLPPGSASAELESFADSDEVSSYAQDALGRLLSEDLLDGYEDGNLGPKNPISRAEAVTVLDRLAPVIMNHSGSYADVTSTGSGLINTSDVTLKNAKLGGDLYLTAGIGDGDVTLQKVTVDGVLYVNGGGANSIHIEDSDLTKVVVDKPDKPVRVVLSGSSKVESMSVETGAVIEVEKGANIESLQIEEDAAGTNITAQGSINKLENQAEDVKLNDKAVEKGKETEVTPSPSVSPTPAPGSGGSSGGSTGGSNPSTSPSTSPAVNWQLVWSDEFDASGDNLDTNGVNLDKWAYQQGTGAEYVEDGWGNREEQYYKKENAKVENGILSIEAKKETVEGKPYTSARLWTQPTFSKTYGKFEARMKLPVGQGLWPAFWLLPKNSPYGGWAAGGEIDIMEARGRLPGEVYGTIHYGKAWPNNKNTGGAYTWDEGEGSIADFHTYTLEWEPGELRWYVDGQLFNTETNWFSHGVGQPDKYAFPAPFDQEFYILLNLAVGGNFDGGVSPPESALPGKMEVDYVRVYELTGRPYKTPVEPVVIQEPIPGSVTPDSTGNYARDTAYAGGFEALTGEPLHATKWNIVSNTSGAAAASVDPVTMDNVTANFAKLNITNGGLNDYSVQLIQKLPLYKGHYYKVSFDAKSNADRNLNVKLSGGSSRSWTPYSDVYSAALTNEINDKPYSFIFQMVNESDPEARLEFNAGLNTSPVWIGNVRVEEAEGLVERDGTKEPLEDGNHVYNGTFDLGTMERFAFWNFTTNGAVAEKSVDPAARTLQVAITDGGDAAGDVQLFQKGINLLQRDTYELKFDARAAEARTIEVDFLSKNGTVSYSGIKTVELSAEQAQETVTFSMPEGVTDTEGQLIFRLGGDDADVWLDNVVLRRTTDLNKDYSTVEIFPLKNGDFSLDLLAWEPFKQVGEAAFSTVDGEAKVGITNVGTERWNVMLNQGGMKFSKGWEYELSFDAKSTAARDFDLSLENATYNARFERKSLALTPQSKHFSYTFRVPNDETLALKFLLGKTAAAPTFPHDVFIDNVVLQVKGAPFLKPPILIGDNTNNKLGQPIEVTFADNTAWREALQSVQVGTATLPAASYTVSAGKLTLAADVFAEAGNHTVKIFANGYAPASVVQQVLPSDGNLIVNGDMSGGESGWGYWAAADDWSDRTVADGAAKIDIHYNGGTDNEWQVPYSWSTQLFQEGIKLEAGKKYELSFKAWSTVNRPVEVELNGYSGNKKVAFNLTADPSTVHTTTLEPTAGLTLKLLYLLGNVVNGTATTPTGEHTIYIDDVVLKEAAPASGGGGTTNPDPVPTKVWRETGPSVITNGTFDTDMSSWNIHNQADYEQWAGKAQFNVTGAEVNAQVTQVGWDWWQIQLYQENVPVAQGTYKVSMDISSERDRPVYVELATSGVPIQKLEVSGTTKKNYEKIINIPVAGSYKFLIGLGRAPADSELAVPYTIKIDNVKLVPVVEETTTGGGANVTDTLYLASGHTLSKAAGGTGATDTIPMDQTVVTYQLDQVTGTYKGTGTTSASLYLNGKAVGIGLNAKVYYDFTGDGTWDREEQTELMPTDGNTASGSYELFTRTLAKVTGSDYADFSNGKIKVEVFTMFGAGDGELKVSAPTEASLIKLPYELQ